jgi:hypothetical protein
MSSAAPPVAAPTPAAKGKGKAGGGATAAAAPPASAPAAPGEPAAVPGRPFKVGEWVLPEGRFDLLSLGWGPEDAERVQLLSGGCHWHGI